MELFDQDFEELTFPHVGLRQRETEDTKWC